MAQGQTRESVKMALDTLRTNKLRSGLQKEILFPDIFYLHCSFAKIFDFARRNSAYIFGDFSKGLSNSSWQNKIFRIRFWSSGIHGQIHLR